MSAATLVFDLDDTLYSERQFAISGFDACERWLLEHHGKGDVATEMTRMLDEGHMRALFVQVLEKRLSKVTPELVEQFIDVYRYHEPEISLYPDAVRALDHFGSKGPIGLITDGQHEVQSSKVRALGIAGRFHHIVYTGALGGRAFSKPHPLGYEKIEEALGKREGPFVYVGDNPAKDFLTPNRRGWISVQIIRPHRIHARAVAVEGGDAHHVIETLDELPGILASAS